MKKYKLPVASPAQIEAKGKLSAGELSAISGSYIREELLAADRRLAAARSLALGGEGAPPTIKKGGKSYKVPEHTELVLDGGKIKQILHKRPYGAESAFVDWVNFTIGEETAWKMFDESDLLKLWKDFNFKEFNQKLANQTPLAPAEIMVTISELLVEIFGFGVTAQRDKGANFYKTSFALGPFNQKTRTGEYGMVCYGGQRNTILVMLSGSGCAAAKFGWELRLKQFLESANRAKLTRLDLAHDDYTGETYSVDKANQDHTDGLFNSGGRNPECEHRGDWKNPTGKGRTIYFGSRRNGKYCRVYEKGRQLGDENSPWTRIEVEFKSVDRVIPFDALINPGHYLAASYPAFVWIDEHQERILTTQKVCESNVARAVKWIRHQVGPSIGAMVELFGVDDFLQKVVRPGDVSWAKVPVWTESPPPIQIDPLSRLSLSSAAFAVDF